MNKTHTDYNVFGISCQKGLPNDLKFHTHFQYEVFIFRKGQCNYAVGNRIYELHPGDIVIMDGSLMHRPFVFDNPRFYERSIVQFSSEWIRPVLNVLDANHLLDSFETNHFAIYNGNDLASIDEIEENIQKIETYVRDYTAESKEVELKLEVIQVLLKINNLQQETDLRNSVELGEKYAFVQEAVQYVQQNFQEKFNLNDVAEELNLSKSYLVHLFKELTGNTIMDYTMSYRLKQAMHMIMAYPEMKSKEICFRCGFENESHFSRYFKTNTGLSPREFRKTNVLNIRK